MKTPKIYIDGIEITLRQAQYISLILHDRGLAAVADFFNVQESAIYSSLKVLRAKLGANSCIGVGVSAVFSSFDLHGNYGNFYLFADYPDLKWPFTGKAA